ncbi:flagellar rod assembly protein/muramidase FlgJ [Thiohalobacter sp. COW1]|uniref:flagellar assembly peptidoglycan hydrolase FlgJ n=1 Tax=Thiohalobacter sp. COW1 TaxID=2795687 RepID=UPI0019160F28|nr:flagellar assembly peptidoglycan hydrolase FlgJ [Thiohalobacter sp. COW1]BCO31086.1 flagellar rod assembly protein/muramidase FlgJ [Thiohalobacter sp. COW1]
MNKVADANAFMDLQGLAALKSRAVESGGRDIDTLRRVAGQFESLFVQMLLKNMRATSFDEGGLLNNDQIKFYQQMFDQQIAVEATKGKGLGIADMLVRQLGGEPRSAGETGMQAPPQVPAVTRETLFGPQAAVAPAENNRGQDAQHPHPDPLPAAGEGAKVSLRAESLGEPGNPREFIRALWPHARRAAAALGVPPEGVLAQAALETGWGRHVMQQPDGRSSHNLFGIKADARWSGEQVSKPTLEFREGVMQQERAAFRAYDSLGAGFEDYARFLQEQPRYREALRADSAEAFAAALQQAGYATDPQYARKINAIMNHSDFRQQVAALKQAEGGPLASAGESGGAAGQLPDASSAAPSRAQES